MNATTLRGVETFLIVFVSVFLSSVATGALGTGSVDLSDPLTVNNLATALLAAVITAWRRASVTASG